MKKILKYILLILFFSTVVLFSNKSYVKAVTKTINTAEELKEAFEGKAIVEENRIKLIDNVTLKDEPLDVYISELVIDFNGKTIECKENGHIRIFDKVTLIDSSTVNRLECGGCIFNGGSIDIWNKRRTNYK